MCTYNWILSYFYVFKPFCTLLAIIVKFMSNFRLPGSHIRA